MPSRSLFSNKHVWSLVLSSTFLGLLLVASACERIPNTIPFGYEGVFKHPARSSSAARVDYSIVYTVNQDASSLDIRISKNGERFWIYEREFWKQELWKPITWYRFSLTAFGVDNAICVTEWIKPGADDVMTVPCRFNNGKTAKDYLSKPLAGMLDYWVGGDEKNHPKDDPPEEAVAATGDVDRLYYLIPKD